MKKQLTFSFVSGNCREREASQVAYSQLHGRYDHRQRGSIHQTAERRERGIHSDISEIQRYSTTGEAFLDTSSFGSHLDIVTHHSMFNNPFPRLLLKLYIKQLA